MLRSQRTARPTLEVLEGRDLPSTIGFFAPSLVQPLTQLTSQINNATTQMQTDFNNGQTASQASQFGTADQNYAKALNDYGQIQAYNNAINQVVKADQTFLLVGIAAGIFDQNDTFFLLSAFKTINDAKSAASSDLSTANGILNTTFANNNFFSSNTGQTTLASVLNS